jgi:hypothetical protein
MDRCILVDYSKVICSKGKYLDFFNITNVSDKIGKYNNVSTSIEEILRNSTNCSYAVWVSEQLNRSRSINDVDEALKAVYNISVSGLLADDCVKKAPVVVQNATNETVERNTTAGTKNKTGAVSTASQAQTADLPLLAILIIAVIIAAAAYFLLNRKKKNGGYSRFNK